MQIKKTGIITVFILVIEIILLVGFLFRIVEARVAYPIMFICIGCQQLLNGVNLDKKSKKLKTFSILLGTISILFAIFVVIPSYYFK